MASFNKVILMGNLTREPELRYTPKGASVAQFGIAVNRQWTNDAGQKQDEVTFIDITSWGKTAEVICQYLHKGDPIHIEGRLKLDQWDDKKTGDPRSKLSVVVESFQFVGGKKDGGQAPSRPAWPGESSQAAPGRTPPRTAQQRVAEGAQADGPPPDDDDVPF